MNAAVRFSSPSSAPGLRYRDVGAAVEWLCRAFGFERHSVSSDAHGGVSYAEVSFGNTIIMLGAVQDSEIDRLMKQPDEVGGAETQGSYYIVNDADAHYQRARDAGAEIVLDIKTDANGDRTYSCRDPEGHLWTFGTYDPWRADFTKHRIHNDARAAAEARLASVKATAGSRSRRSYPASRQSSVTRLVGGGLLLSAVVPGVVAAWMFGSGPDAQFNGNMRQATLVVPANTGPATSDAQRAIEEARQRLSFERSARQVAESALVAARQETVREQELRRQAELTASELAKKLLVADQSSTSDVWLAQQSEQALNAERTAKDRAERAATEALAKLTEAESVRVASVQAAQELQDRLAFLSDANAGAERTAKDALQSAESERKARETAEQMAEEIRKQLADEQAARFAAEKAASAAQTQLEQERAAKQSALRTVEQMKRKLAMAGAPKAAKAAPAVKKAKPVALQKAQPKQDVLDGWDVYSGPVW